jgi:hypothetical protein
MANTHGFDKPSAIYKPYAVFAIRYNVFLSHLL